MKRHLLFAAFASHLSILSAQHFVPVLKVGDELIDQSSYCDDDIYDLQVWNDTLIVGGEFNYFFGEYMPRLAKWDGQQAHPFQPTPELDFTDRVTDITPFNNQLIICGRMPEYNGAAIFDGNSWSAFGLFGEYFLPEIVEYNEALYTFSQGSLYRNDDGNWTLLNLDIENDISDLEVYQNKLYVAVDQTIHSFDGSDWYNYELGLDQPINMFSIANNRLIATGSFTSDADSALYNHMLEVVGNSIVPFSLTIPANLGEPGKIYYQLDKYLVTDYYKHSMGAFRLPTIYFVEGSPLTLEHDHAPRDIEFYNGLYLSGVNGEGLYSEMGIYELVYGQDLTIIDNDILKPVVSPIASHFGTPRNRAGFLFSTPENESTATIYASALWMYGIAENDTIVSANTFDQHRNLIAGPIADEITREYINRFFRVYAINKAEVLLHTQQYMNPNYVMPEVILNWPAHGDTSNGEAHHLAPFQDINSNGQYDPELGDYPLIKGDECAYFVLNDKRSYAESFDLAELLPDSLNIEIHVMMYLYDDEIEAANHSLFINYRIINRSDKDYEHFRTAVWTDWDIGNSTDDYVGCDSLLNYYYGFNGDAFDDAVSTSFGYGQYPAASGCVLLNQQMTNALYYHIGTNPIMGDPSSDNHYFNFMNSTWKNGSDLLWGGNGVSGSGVLDFEANYMYPSYPWETDGLIWNEEQAGNPPGDRRMLASGEEIFLGKDEEFCFDIAYVVARDTSTLFDPNLASLQLLKSYVSQVQQFYNDENNTCYKNSTEPTGDNGTKDDDWFQIYPNPGGDQIAIAVPYDGQQYQIVMYDAIGQLVMDTTITGDKPFQSIDTRNLADAGYLIGLRKQNDWVVRKWIKISNP